MNPPDDRPGLPRERARWSSGRPPRTPSARSGRSGWWLFGLLVVALVAGGDLLVTHHLERHGPREQLYDDGSLARRFRLRGGLLDGPDVSWYRDGTPKREGSWKAGRPSGAWKEWHPNGTLRSEGSYEEARDGRPVRPTGLWIAYADNGMRVSEGRFAGGVKIGLWREWHPNGELASEGHHADANAASPNRPGQRIGRWRYGHPNGRAMALGAWIADERTGPWTEWFANGQKRSEGRYLDGERVGTWRFWYESGTLERETEVWEEDGITWRRERRFYADGTELSVQEFRAGQPHGEVRQYLPTGELGVRGRFERGLKHGHWQVFDRSGEIVLDEHWRDGARLEASGPPAPTAN